jgi:predicted membrane-bound spermidine synthase
MGASLPLRSRGIVLATEGAARTICLLYGLNTRGAGLGAFTSVWYLVGNLGFVGTIRLAAVLNLLVAAGALLLRRGTPAEERDGGTTEAKHDRSFTEERQGVRASFGLGTWAMVYGLSGFIALSLEIVWFRVLDVTIKSSPYTFGHLLGLFLLFLGLGSVVGGLHVRRVRRPDLAFLGGQWAISLLATIALLLLAYLPTDSGPLRSLYPYWSGYYGIEMAYVANAWESWSGLRLPGVLAQFLQVYFLLPLSLLAIPTFLMGWTYAFIQRTVQTDIREIGWRVGVIQTANIVGSILGSLLTGALFLSWLGTPGTVRLLVALGSVFGCLTALRGNIARRRLSAFAVVASSLALAATVPSAGRFWARLHGSTPQAAVVGEDASSVVAITVQAKRNVLWVNGGGHSELPYGGVHTLLGAVPALVHPGPRSALVVGLGSGETAWAIASAPTLERIDVFELARPEVEVLGAFRERHRDWELHGVDRLFNDPRVRLTFIDGRLALRHERSTYDMIEADALEVFMAYSGNLYSREFFELASEALNPGGLFCSYVPTYRVRRTILRVFPYALEFDAFIIAGNDPLRFDRDAVLARLQSEPVQAYLRPLPQVAARLETFVREANVLEHGPEDRERFIAGDFNSDLFPRDEFDMRPDWKDAVDAATVARP